jgi:hypothetical protein
MFQLRWTVSAKEALRRIISTAPENVRSEIMAAAYKLESRLQREGAFAGESRTENVRVLIEPPLSIYVWVGPDEYLDTITVIRVLHRTRKP